MLKRNIGKGERALRMIVGLALLAGFFLDADAAYRWFYLVGLVPLITGLAGNCRAIQFSG